MTGCLRSACCALSRQGALLSCLVFAVACASSEPQPRTAVQPSPHFPQANAEPGVQLAGVAAPAPQGITTAELDRRTAELFGERRGDLSIALPPELAPASADSEPTWDIDVRSYETLERVRHYVAAFSGSSRDRFAERMSRGTRYEAMIRAKLKAGGLPEDMYYLALVESGYNPHAYSRAAAVGMWQFMTTTARGMGLRVDWWIDERRDPVRSTDAAVRFLSGLNEQFGSLYLAAAAYNGGPGRVARGLTRYATELEGTSGDDMFFALVDRKYLRNETREYVPQLIAAALVAKEPDRYGIPLVAREPLTYDSARVPPRVPLATIAEAAGTSVAVIQELNPYILRGMTPPGARDTMMVRLPPGSAARFDSAFATMPPDRRVGAKTLRSEKGATWASIGRKAGIPSRVLALYNPAIKPSKKTAVIPTGSAILVPGAEVVAAALPVPDPSIERYGSGNRTHVVRRGENLSVIAKRYKTTSAAIMRLNRLKRPLIFPGQELLVRR